jgi:hypothetical protein
MAPGPDGSPAESPLDVERVEWFSSSPEALEVRVSGRWRGTPQTEHVELLVDDAGDRRRFRAVSVGVDEAGAWHARFAVPVELRARLAARLALKAGDRELSLPAASPGPADEGAAPPPATIVESTVLAERRARREGLADETLVRRAQAAEATVTTLETQLDNLEARLRDALAERDRLSGRLRAAEQREEAERRVRSEAEDERDEVAAAGERRLAELRARVRTAEEHAAALASEMDAVRREGAEAQHAAAAARAAAERAERAAAEREAAAAAQMASLAAEPGGHVQVELDHLRREAASLTGLLDAERAARGEAESRLMLQADRVAEVEATVALLEHELDRRARIQTNVQVELEELREALVRVRAQAEEESSRQGGARRALEELKVTATGLRERIASLEATERQARAELRDAQAQLESRGRELARARADLELAQSDLATARAAEDSRAAALREAERIVVAVRREASELQARLDEERRRRFEVEAMLRAELERERETFGAAVAGVEAELRARIAAERNAFEAQAASIEAMVGELRVRLASAGDELEGRIEGERRLRDEALAERDAALADADRIKLEVAADLERAASERDELLGRLLVVERELADARRDAEQHAHDVGSELAGRLAEAETERDRLASELERLRQEVAAAAERETVIEALVADVVGMASALREDFGGALEQLAGQIEGEVASLRAQLEEERTARWVAEQELAAERDRGVAVARPAIVESLTRTELEVTRRELAAAQEQLAAERARSDDSREQASQLVHDLEAAWSRLKVREEEPVVEESAISPPEEESAVEELQAAESAVEAPPAVEEPPAEEPAVAEPAVAEPVAEEPVADDAAVEEPPAEDAAWPAGAWTAPPPGAALLTPRVVDPRRRRPTPWLAPAIGRLSAGDEAAAARLLVALLPAQAGLVRDPVSYGLTIDGHGTYRVDVRPEWAEAQQRLSADALGTVDVALAGTVGALAPLAAGGAPRRLRNVRVEGRKRRIRKLLRARRAPLDLAELAARGIHPDPALMLAVVAAAVDPAWTTGHRFSVVYAVTGEEPVEVEVRDGAPLAVASAARERTYPPAATVSLRRDALIPLLTRVAPPPGERALVAGNQHAIAVLHSWFDQAQGLPQD